MVVGGELQENLNAHIAGIHDPDAYHFGYVGRDEYLEISATLTFTLTFICTYLISKNECYENALISSHADIPRSRSSKSDRLHLPEHNSE